jgi:hypothetical protein
MPDPVKRTARSNTPTTPEDFPTTSPLPSGDYSYTVEIVMKMQLALGKLTEAIDGPKADSRELRGEVSKLGKDMHAAKVVFGVVGTLIAGAVAFAGWAIKAYLDFIKK